MKWQRKIHKNEMKELKALLPKTCKFFEILTKDDGTGIVDLEDNYAGLTPLEKKVMFDDYVPKAYVLRNNRFPRLQGLLNKLIADPSVVIEKRPRIIIAEADCYNMNALVKKNGEAPALVINSAALEQSTEEELEAFLRHELDHFSPKQLKLFDELFKTKDQTVKSSIRYKQEAFSDKAGAKDGELCDAMVSVISKAHESAVRSDEALPKVINFYKKKMKNTSNPQLTEYIDGLDGSARPVRTFSADTLEYLSPEKRIAALIAMKEEKGRGASDIARL